MKILIWVLPMTALLLDDPWFDKPGMLRSFLDKLFLNSTK
jgi:hypothetical protein